MTDLPHILVVEDEPDMSWALENTLKEEGYRITLTAHGKEALRLAKDGNFKIALIDAKLLDMDGIKLCRQIRQLAPETRVILISGYLYRGDKVVQDGLKDGVFRAFIGKPFDIDEVRRVVKEALGID